MRIRFWCTEEMLNEISTREGISWHHYIIGKIESQQRSELGFTVVLNLFYSIPELRGQILNFLQFIGRDGLGGATIEVLNEVSKLNPSCYGIKRETIERWIGQLMTASVYGEFDPVSRDHVERIISELEIIIS